MMNMKNRLKGHLQQRGDNITGIQEAVNAKKAMKRMKKVNMIADGIMLGEAKSKIFGYDD